MLVIKERVVALEKNGIEATILAFKRNYYPGKSFDNDYTLLGNISHGTSAKSFTATNTALFQMPCWGGYSIIIGIRSNAFIRD
jgi:hypothetical protein